MLIVATIAELTDGIQHDVDDHREEEQPIGSVSSGWCNRAFVGGSFGHLEKLLRRDLLRLFCVRFDAVHFFILVFERARHRKMTVLAGVDWTDTVQTKSESRHQPFVGFVPLRPTESNGDL